MSVSQFFFTPNRVIDSNGIADGASIEFLVAGTTTPQAAYADSARTTPLANPLSVAAGAAVPAIYLDPALSYRIRIKDSSGTAIPGYDYDPYVGVQAGGVIDPETGEPILDVLNEGGRYTPAIPGASTRTGQDKARETVSLDESPGATDAIKAQAAVDYLASVGGGVLRLPRREIILNKTVFGASNVTIQGEGCASHIRFSGTIPTSISGTSYTNPLQGNFRTAAIAIVGQYPDDITSANYSASHTGDYPVIEPRAFAANSVIKAGSISFEAASSGDLSDVSAGDYLWLDRGFMGWHSAIHEMVQVASISGTTVTLVWPTQYEYRNASTDPFNLFMKPIAYQDGTAAPGVDQATYNSWRQCGWRRIDPIVNAWVKDVRITNEANHAGYANLALIYCRAFNCGFENIELSGGGLWNIDSEGTHGHILRTKRSSSSVVQTDLLPGNGCNRTRITGMDIQTGTFDVEEGCLKGFFQGRVNGNTKNIQYCRDNTFELESRNSSGYGLLFKHSGSARFSGSYQSVQPTIWVQHRDIFYDYPQATLAMYDSLIGIYFDGTSIEGECELVESTANNSLEFYLEQPIRARARVGGAFGGVYNLVTSAQGYVIGNVKRLADGSDQTAPIVSARPAGIFPIDRDLTFTDGTNDKVWRRVNLNRKTIAVVSNASNFTVNTNTTQGGVKTGDIAMVLIQNTATVSVDTLKYVDGAPTRTPVSYTAGNARKWHISDVASVNTDTGEVTLTTAVPANWGAVAGGSDVSCVFFGRWG